MKNKTKLSAGLAAIVAAIVTGVFAVEGGYVDNPKDPGGKTNHGVTEVVARQHGYEGHMRDLSKEQATDIYTTDYIVKPGYLPLVELSPALGEEIVDSGVNAGTGRSSRWFQTALNMLNRNGQDYPNIVVDGAVGPASIRAYESLRRVRGNKKACQLVIKLMDAQQAQHYMNLRNGDEKFSTFMVGWIDTRVGNVNLEHCS